MGAWSSLGPSLERVPEDGRPDAHARPPIQRIRVTPWWCASFSSEVEGPKAKRRASSPIAIPRSCCLLSLCPALLGERRAGPDRGGRRHPSWLRRFARRGRESHVEDHWAYSLDPSNEYCVLKSIKYGFGGTETRRSPRPGSEEDHAIDAMVRL